MDLTRRIQGTARFGCFTDNANRNADIVCLLCVSYNFTDDPQMVRKGNNKDLENIKSSFHDDRHCHYQHLQSPKKEKLLHLLSEKDRLMRFFQTNDVPSVFVLIVLSHGDENGVIYTDYQLENGLYDTFTTYQIVDSMKKLQSWEKCLNLLIFAPCRGTLKDVIVSAGSPQPAPFPNKNSCKITNFPGADNFIIVYSTVETTRANRDRYGGTWLVSKICETLDDLTESTTIENFFSMVHFNINEISTSHGQTLEIVQTAHPKFKIYKNISNQGTGDVDAVAKDTFYMDTADSMKRTYYLWKSQSGEQLRRKRGVICGDCKHAGDIEKALRENLDFETDTLSATDFSLEKLRRLVQGGQCTMGCFLVCCFASAIEENKADKELCVQIGANRIKISDFVYLFVGPHNMEWIGRPKIFFFVRTPTATDAYNSMSTEFTIKATNQAGIFICVLNHENAAEKMENFLKNPLLRDGSTLQELAGDLLQECQDNESTPKSLIVSTLSYQLDFPVWSPNFVPPKFMVTRFSNEKAIEDENAPDALKEHYSYDELRWDYQKQYIDNDSNEYCVWVISSKSGSGKTTTLKELQCFTNRYQRIKKTAFVPLLRNFQNLQKSKPFDAMEFLQRTQALATNDDGSLIHERKVVIFLDGIDEVCPELKKEIMGIVKIFAQMKLPLLITSRPHEEKEILEALKGVTVKIIEIEPFEQERQIQLLRQITSKSEMECSQILYKLRQLGATDILKNPFHLTLILNFGTQNNIHEGSLFSVFEVVLEETIRETLMKKEPYDRNHYKFGVEVVSRMELLQKVAKMHQCDTICVTKLSDNDIIKINNTGVATVQNDKKTVMFYHQSYAEFLLAGMFIREIRDQGSSQIPIFQKKNFRQCRLFVDSFLSEESRVDKNLAQSLMNYFKNDTIQTTLKLVVTEGLRNVFLQLRTKVKFTSSITDEDSHFCLPISKGRELLAEACKTDEVIAIELLKMGILETIEKNVKNQYVSCLIDNIATTNSEKVFDALKNNFSEIQEILKSSKDLQALSIAASHGNLGMVKRLIENGVDTEIVDTKNKWTALLAAVQNGHHDVVKYLVENSENPADTSVRDGCGKSCLHYAACISGSRQTLNLLIEKDHSLLKEKSNDGSTVLHYAARSDDVDLCRYFIEEGVDLEAVDKQGMNALHIACMRNRLQNVKYFIRVYNDNSTSGDSLALFVNKRTNDQMTPLLLAAAHSNYLVCDFLVSNRADLNAVDKNGNNSLHFAALGGKLENIKYFSQKDYFGAPKTGFKSRTLLHQAALKNHVAVAKFLLDKGADINTRDDDEATPLHIACAYASVEMCQLLIARNADLRAFSRNRRTILHLAASEGNLQVVQLLLDFKVFEIDEKDGHGQTALHSAASNGHVDVAKCLLQNGFDINARADDLRTPLSMGAENPTKEMCMLLLENGADLSLKCSKGNGAIHWASVLGRLDNVTLLLIKDISLIENKGARKRTPILIAAANGHTKVVEYLIKKGAAINVQDECRSTALTLAAHHSTPEMCRLLINNNADVKRRDIDGDNALHCAVKNDKIENVEFLLSTKYFREKIYQKNRLGSTVFDIAKIERSHDITSFLHSLAPPRKRWGILRRLLRFTCFFKNCGQRHDKFV